MPTFDDQLATSAPVEEVWKLLYDPARFPEWWQGFATAQPGGVEGRGDFTLFPEGYPDFPMPQTLRMDAGGRRVTVSCVLFELVFAWRLEPIPEGDGTRIHVHVDVPEAEAHRLDGQREAVSASLAALAALAAGGDPATDAPRARG